MCTYSVVADYGRQNWGYPYIQPAISVAPVVDRVPTVQEWKAFLELINKAQKFDEAANQADCPDPHKTEWMERMESMMAIIMAKLDALEGDDTNDGQNSVSQ